MSSSNSIDGESRSTSESYHTRTIFDWSLDDIAPLEPIWQWEDQAKSKSSLSYKNDSILILHTLTVASLREKKTVRLLIKFIILRWLKLIQSILHLYIHGKALKMHIARQFHWNFVFQIDKTTWIYSQTFVLHCDMMFVCAFCIGKMNVFQSLLKYLSLGGLLHVIVTCDMFTWSALWIVHYLITVIMGEKNEISWRPKFIKELYVHC